MNELLSLSQILTLILNFSGPINDTLGALYLSRNPDSTPLKLRSLRVQGVFHSDPVMQFFLKAVHRRLFPLLDPVRVSLDVQSLAQTPTVLYSINQDPSFVKFSVRTLSWNRLELLEMRHAIPWLPEPDRVVLGLKSPMFSRRRTFRVHLGGLGRLDNLARPGTSDEIGILLEVLIRGMKTPTFGAPGDFGKIVLVVKSEVDKTRVEAAIRSRTRTRWGAIVESEIEDRSS